MHSSFYLLLVISVLRLFLVPITIFETWLKAQDAPGLANRYGDFLYRVVLLGLCAIVLGFEWIIVYRCFAFNRKPGFIRRWITPVYMVFGITVNAVWFPVVWEFSRYPVEYEYGIIYLIPTGSTTLVSFSDPTATESSGLQRELVYDHEPGRIALTLLCMATITFLTTGFVYFRAFRIKSAIESYEPISQGEDQGLTGSESEASTPTIEGHCARAYRLGLQTAVRASAPQTPQPSFSSTRPQNAPPDSSASFHPAVKFWHTTMYPYGTASTPFIGGYFWMTFLAAGHLVFQAIRYHHIRQDGQFCSNTCAFSLVYPLLWPAYMFLCYLFIKKRMNPAREVIFRLRLFELMYAIQLVILGVWTWYLVLTVRSPLWFDDMEGGTVIRWFWGIFNGLCLVVKLVFTVITWAEAI